MSLVGTTFEAGVIEARLTGSPKYERKVKFLPISVNFPPKQLQNPSIYDIIYV